jgi:hypothetical protein
MATGVAAIARTRDRSRAMIELDVSVPAGADLAQIEQAVERTCAGAGLRNTHKRALASYPGSVHWHYARPPERGTLELTWWPARRRLWFKVSAGRTAPWITALLPQLQHSLQAAWQPSPAPTMRSTSNTF